MTSLSGAACWDRRSKYANVREYAIISGAARADLCAPVVELADTLDLGSSAKACRFESCQAHQFSESYEHEHNKEVKMEQSVRDYFTEKVNDLIAAPSCCAEAKAAGQAWLDAAGTDKEAEASKALLEEVKVDITPIDGLIGFVGSDMGAKIFGEERAKAMLAHAKEIKGAGAEYCDCPACAACAAILERADELK